MKRNFQTSKIGSNFAVDLVLSKSFNENVYADIVLNKSIFEKVVNTQIGNNANSNIRAVRMLKLLDIWARNGYKITKSEVIAFLTDPIYGGSAEYGYGKEELEMVVNLIMDGCNLTPDGIEETRDSLENIAVLYVESNNTSLRPMARNKNIKQFNYLRDGGYDETTKIINFYDDSIDDEFDKIYDNPLHSSFDYINNLKSGVNGYIRGQLVVVAASPGAGKSAFLMNETSQFLKDGHDVLYLAIGDLTELDMASRISQIYYDVSPSSELWHETHKKPIDNEVKNEAKMLFKRFKKEYLDSVYEVKDSDGNTILRDKPINIDGQAVFLPLTKSKIGKLHGEILSPGVKTADDMVNKIKWYIKNGVKIFMVDYDSGIKSGNGESLYMDSAVIYEKLAGLVKGTDVTIFIASQIKMPNSGKGNNGGWNTEKVGLDALSESSRKQAHIDLMLGVGLVAPREDEKSPIRFGMVNIPKNRRGRVGSFNFVRLPSLKMMELTLNQKKALQSVEKYAWRNADEVRTELNMPRPVSTLVDDSKDNPF